MADKGEVMCRLCGDKKCEKKFNLFDRNTAPGGLAVKIRRHLRVQVHPNDGLPQQTCEPCKTKVLEIHTFVRSVHNTQVRLITEMAKQKKTSVDEILLKHPVTKPSKPVTNAEKTSTSILQSILTNPTPVLPKKPPSSKPPPLLPLLIKFSNSGTPTISTTSMNSSIITSNGKSFIVQSSALGGRLATGISTMTSINSLKSATNSSRPSALSGVKSTAAESCSQQPLEATRQSVQAHRKFVEHVASSQPSVEVKEEPFDPSYSDISIKEEPMDTIDDYIEGNPLSSTDDEMNLLSVKKEMEEETDEEDLEVTLDPMEFLLREDSNSNGSTKETEYLEPEEMRVEPSTDTMTIGKTSGGITLKKFSELKARKPRKPRTRSRPVFVDKRSEPKPYQCAICPRGYFSDIGLQNHLWSHRKILKNSDSTNVVNKGNEQASPLKKTAPTNQFSNITASNLLSYNNAMFCKEAAKYQCPLCNKKINTRTNLRRHLQAHRHRGTYSCEICSRVFKTKVNLTRHLECHNTETLSCPVCSRVYPTNSTLRAHMISHSNDRPHSCPFCDKTFKRNQDLKFHLNQHTGERPYKCPFCDKTFASSGNCFSHRKRMHSSEVVPATSGEEDKDTEEAEMN